MKKSNSTAHSAFEYIKSLGGISEYKVKSNGLTVLLMPQHAVPLVNVMVTYNVGSRNEAVGHTGATHLLEHLMFKGSKLFNKANKKQIWNLLEARGAKLNATTWFDRTNYYELVPKQFLEDALAIEADRMRNAYIREADRVSEMPVVRNEFEWNENSAFDTLDKNMWATAFREHPYHHPTIGWRSDIENVSIKRLKEFYDTFYWPNNAVLSIIGDVRISVALELVNKYFGKIPPSPHLIPQVYTSEPRQEGERRFILSRVGTENIVGIGHKVPEALHVDSYALQVLSNILGGGKSSRLHRALVDCGLGSAVEVLNFPLRDPGLFLTYVFLTVGVKHEKVEQIILDEYEKIKKYGVSEDELTRAKALMTSGMALSRDGYCAIATALNECIAVGDWTYYVNFIERVMLINVSEIQRVAQEYFLDEQKTVGWFLPKSMNLKAK